jgi:hypothetical protein
VTSLLRLIGTRLGCHNAVEHRSRADSAADDLL